MSLDSSGISWTDGTLNSLYGCTQCPDGCRQCYAIKRVYRHALNSKHNIDGRYDGLVRIVNAANKEASEKPVKLAFTGRVLFDPKHLYQVLEDKRPKKIFVNEFSDLFHNALPMEVILEHMRVFQAAPWHQFQTLTKRGKRLGEVNAAVLEELGKWPDNVWVGVSVCTAKPLDLERIDALGETQAKLKWISFEPWISDPQAPLRESVPDLRDRLHQNGISWVVIGGESGSKGDTDLMTLDDARYLLEASKAAGCRVHFKQLGTGLAIQLGVYAVGEHRSKGGNPEQWPDDLMVQEWPQFAGAPVGDSIGFTPKYDMGEWRHFDLKSRQEAVAPSAAEQPVGGLEPPACDLAF